MARSQKKLAAMPFTVNKLPAVGIRRCDLKHISAFNPFNGCGAATVSPSGRGAGWLWQAWGGDTVRPLERPYSAPSSGGLEGAESPTFAPFARNRMRPPSARK